MAGSAIIRRLQLWNRSGSKRGGLDAGPTARPRPLLAATERRHWRDPIRACRNVDINNRVAVFRGASILSRRGRFVIQPFSSIASAFGIGGGGGFFGAGAGAGTTAGAVPSAQGQASTGQGFNPFQAIANAISGVGQSISGTVSSTVKTTEQVGFYAGFGIIGVAILLIGILAIIWANTPDEAKSAAVAAVAA